MHVSVTAANDLSVTIAPSAASVTRDTDVSYSVVVTNKRVAVVGFKGDVKSTALLSDIKYLVAKRDVQSHGKKLRQVVFTSSKSSGLGRSDSRHSPKRVSPSCRRFYRILC